MARARIDWEAARKRIMAADAAIARAWDPDEDEVALELRKRADRLARENEGERESRDVIDVVDFMLDRARYAIESGYVRDIYPLERMTPIPCTPDFVLGIVNLRGEILSVIDIMKFIGIARNEAVEPDRLIVLEQGDMRFCILADAVSGVIAIRKDAIQEPMPALGETEHIYGIADGQLVLLDGQALLQDPRLIVNEEI